ncbi:Morn repeat protein [Pandoravirus inopinatum]|uniref:Morn repeat protein n=1 Tax=Pandoravirus inopinatum TaxID=1605721 RepID=A0A0B5JE18_9VIRU|nr:Morn repeat protein [Pandoravirus inopinatum]AJF98007.1 Morn repeat protein [Pandoravirus inopinatum]
MATKEALQAVGSDCAKGHDINGHEQTSGGTSSDGDCLLLKLPEELLLMVFAARNDPEVPARMAPVARRLHALSRDDALWRRMYERRHGSPVHRHFADYGKDWRWLYRARSQRGTANSTGPGCVAMKKHTKKHFYCGDLERGVPHGYGLNVHIKAQVIVKGIDPRNAFVQPSRSRIEGLWANGQPHGRMIETLTNGDCYEGECADGLRHGQGTYTRPGNFTYQGAYVNGYRKGWGVLRCASGHRYEGQWARGGWNGQGTRVLPDGRSHQGHWQMSTPHGRGVHAWPNGQRVEGTWDGGSHPCGQAVLITADGRRFFDDADEVFCVGGVAVPDGVDFGGRIKCMREGPTDDPMHPVTFDALYLDGSRLFVGCPTADHDRTCRVLAHSSVCMLADHPIEQDSNDAAVGTCMACLLVSRARGQTDAWYDLDN